jgi:hypothetical protein
VLGADPGRRVVPHDRVGTRVAFGPGHDLQVPAAVVVGVPGGGGVGLQLPVAPGAARLVAPAATVHRRVLCPVEPVGPGQAGRCGRTADEGDLDAVDLASLTLLVKPRSSWPSVTAAGKGTWWARFCPAASTMSTSVAFGTPSGHVEDALAGPRQPRLRQVQSDRVGTRCWHRNQVGAHSPALVLVDGRAAGPLDAGAGPPGSSADVPGVAQPPAPGRVHQRRGRGADARHPGADRPAGRAAGGVRLATGRR